MQRGAIAAGDGGHVGASRAGRRGGAWASLSRRPPGKWTFWRYNWIAHHRLISALERARVHARGVLLDVGCGDMRSERWFRGRVTRYLGVDLPGSRFLGALGPTIFARAEALPFHDASVDTVLSMSVLKYVAEPRRLLEEACRVLRPGGVLMLEFTQNAPLDDEAREYFHFTRYGARHLLEGAGFETIDMIPIAGLWTAVGMSWIAALNRLNRGPTRVVTELPVRLLYVAIQLGCALVDRLTFNPREAIAHLAVARRVETRAA